MTETTPQNQVLTFWQHYGKSTLAALFAVWSIAAPLLFGDNIIDRDESIIIAVAIGNAFIVYIVPLNESFKGVKSVVNVVLVALAAVQTVLLDGWQPDDATIVIGAVVAALGVTYAPSASLKQANPVIVPKGLTTG